MPWWWNRRRRPWFGRYKRRKTRRYKRKRFPRRRYRRFTTRRRRRRRRKKVRRKRQTITIKQWQPDSITKCKIKGIGCLCAGADGRQAFCYTNELKNYPQPKAPGGGGFGAEMFTLEYLYKQWVARKNIWTHSNDYKDLVRYTGTTIKLFRHPTTDFIVSYSRQPPFLVEKDYFNEIHPVNMLLKKHKRFIPSLKRKPTGKLYTKIKIKPPKQMITKWFFQRDFASHGLFILEGTACNMGWGYYGPNTQSRCITIRALNTNFYKNTGWGQIKGSHTNPDPYLPYSEYPTTTGLYFFWPYKGAKPTNYPFHPTTTNYYTTVDYSTGFFGPTVLTATKVTTDQSGQGKQHELPITLARYNPDIDTGEKNAVWLESIINERHWQPPEDPDLIIVGKPLWMAFFGFYNYIEKVKKDKGWLKTAMFVCQSPAIELITPTTQTVFPILDDSFTVGKMPFDELLTDQQKKLWFPTVDHQQVVINNFVKSGPYIPKYAYQKESTWELDYMYTSYFKWGGPQIYDQPVQDPEKQGKYDVPDTVQQAVQVVNPLKQHQKQLLRAWDYRRGIITTTALKRMSEHLSPDSSLSSDDSEPTPKRKKVAAEIPHSPKEKKKIQKCLQQLFEENTFQEEEDLKHLIHQQQFQQQQLKRNLLKLLLDLKKKQNILQLQSGIS
nr:MAG: ORF1 [Torque teno midi virus]